MKKTPTVFQRNYESDRLARDEVTPGCEWVLAGEGIPTRKYDGTCCLVEDGALFKRREVKPGKSPPPGFIEVERDEVTGKTVGWVPVGDGPDDQYHREAFAGEFLDGTYELVGPKIQGNPEQYPYHVLVLHADMEELPGCPRDFDGIREYLEDLDIEGIVWQHPDGRMAKIKKKDFGMKR